jgi:hypothetical protein
VHQAVSKKLPKPPIAMLDITFYKINISKKLKKIKKSKKSQKVPKYQNIISCLFASTHST